MDAVVAWRERGEVRSLGGHRMGGHRIFVVDVPAARDEGAEPVLILHGYPSSSFDWRHVVDRLAERRRVIVPDLLGYGFSDKPLDHRYSLLQQADLVIALLRGLALDRIALITHDMGHSVGGELLARAVAGALEVEVTARVITNGSIYMELVQLSAGQQLLLSMPDETLPAEQALGADLFKPALAATFAPGRQPSEEELDAQWQLVSRAGGDRILQRLIRYVEERRMHEGRWTGAIEAHPSPLSILWGALDPIAVLPMAERLAQRRPDAGFTTFDDLGHYPMIEDPDRFADALLAGLP